MNVVTVLLVLSLAVVVVAALLTMIRLTVGPTPLDRVVALDVLAATTIVIVAVMVVFRARVDLVALMIVFVLTQFFSTVTVARFMAGSTRGRGNRPLAPEAPKRHRWEKWLRGKEYDRLENQHATQREDGGDAAGIREDDRVKERTEKPEGQLEGRSEEGVQPK